MPGISTQPSREKNGGPAGFSVGTDRLPQSRQSNSQTRRLVSPGRSVPGYAPRVSSQLKNEVAARFTCGVCRRSREFQDKQAGQGSKQALSSSRQVRGPVGCWLPVKKKRGCECGCGCRCECVECQSQDIRLGRGCTRGWPEIESSREGEGA